MWVQQRLNFRRLHAFFQQLGRQIGLGGLGFPQSLTGPFVGEGIHAADKIARRRRHHLMQVEHPGQFAVAVDHRQVAVPEAAHSRQRHVEGIAFGHRSKRIGHDVRRLLSGIRPEGDPPHHILFRHDAPGHPLRVRKHDGRELSSAHNADEVPQRLIRRQPGKCRPHVVPDGLKKTPASPECPGSSALRPDPDAPGSSATPF